MSEEALVMKWTDKFWVASNWVLDTTIHAIADTMTTCGTLACTLGGVAFAVSNFLMEERVKASYFGSIFATGAFDVNVKVAHTTFGFNESIPVVYSNSVNNGVSYNVADYFKPDMIQTVSAVSALSGIFFKILGANLNKWQYAREQSRLNPCQLSRPHLQEYLYLSAEVLTGSLSNALMSYSVTALSIHFTRLTPRITYPFRADDCVNGSDYSGPIASMSFSVQADLGSTNISIPLPNGGLNVTLRKAIDVMANASYGAGFFLMPKDTSPSPSATAVVALATTVGVGAYLMHSFFGKKGRQLEDRRKHQDDQTSYLPVPTLLIAN